MAFIVKNTTFPGLLDLVSPHSCRGCGRLGEPLCECCKNHIIKFHQNICPNCKNKKTTAICNKCENSSPIYVISERNGILGELIHNYKYYSIRALARPLAEMLAQILPLDLPTNSIIVPLPTATHHIRARGLDHTYLIAKHLSKIRHLKTEQILLRNKNTVQVGTDRKTRLAQAKSAYTLNPKYQIKKDATYILLDDIWTTGASVKSAEKILRATGIKDIRITILAYSS